MILAETVVALSAVFHLMAVVTERYFACSTLVCLFTAARLITNLFTATTTCFDYTTACTKLNAAVAGKAEIVAIFAGQTFTIVPTTYTVSAYSVIATITVRNHIASIAKESFTFGAMCFIMTIKAVGTSASGALCGVIAVTAK